jgi:hypothetical protein
MKTPVAFFFFNRPDLAKLSFEKIRKVQPENLLLISDGPREKIVGEALVVQKTRQYIENRIDWKCKINTCYSNSNLGCKNRIESGLEWVFSQFDRAIIVEDDCILSLDFFDFASSLLNRYKSNTKIAAICAEDLSGGFSRRFKPSYFYSNFFTPWGWATWARSWENSNNKIRFSTESFKEQLAGIIPEVKFREQWLEILNSTLNGKIDTWDYQWIANIWFRKNLVIHPKVNLVKNVGTGINATHTFCRSDPRMFRTAGSLKEPFISPDQSVPIFELEARIRSRFFGNSTTAERRVAILRWVLFHYITRNICF